MSENISKENIKALIAATIGLGVGYLSYSIFTSSNNKEKPKNLDDYICNIEYNDEYEEIVRE